MNRGVSRVSIEHPDFKGSISDFNKAIEITPDKAMAYNDRGKSRENMGDFPGSIDDYSKAIELDQNLALAYVNRGKLRIKLNQKSEACMDFKKAQELGDADAIELIKENCSDL